jgi:hypothetical protein
VDLILELRMIPRENRMEIKRMVMRSSGREKPRQKSRGQTSEDWWLAGLNLLLPGNGFFVSLPYRPKKRHRGGGKSRAPLMGDPHLSCFARKKFPHPLFEHLLLQ